MIYETVQCPNCGKSNYREGTTYTTTMHYPPIYENGINVNPDGNISTTTCFCLNCKSDFKYKTQYGKIISIEETN